MKTAFTSQEIAHVWAHKSAPYGRCPSNISFDGDVILSYQTAIARHISHKGKAAMIVNDTSYSNSTAKHYGKLRRAIPSSVPVFYIGSQPRGTRLDVTGMELFVYATEKAAYCEGRAAKSRRYADIWNGDAAKWLERARFVSQFFGLRKKVDEKTIARLRAESEAAEKRERIAREKREKADREFQNNCYLAWINGGKNQHGTEYFNPRLFPVAFRVEGDELVSTLGARVPLRAAQVAYRFAMSKRGQEWRENGEVCEVGHYRLNAINAQGIVAGCHRITWAELERLAPVLSGETVNA